MSKAQANAQAAAAAASKIDLTWASDNQPCWVLLPEDDPSGEACAKGTIIKLIDEENATVLIDGQKEAKNMRGDKMYAINNYQDAPEGFDDMVDMEHLSEAELLNNMRVRFTGDMIYTYVGPTLIVLNPYKRIDKLLVPGILRGYQDSLLQGKFEPKEHKPHVYAIAAMTMKNLFDNLKNQAIVISGESGAGKTENTKSAMKFLTSLGKSEEDVNSSNGENIEDKILACNPVLEAFGNAKTVRNDNSSRFGKYVALLVEKDTRKIVGATITNYLLEKSRVVGQNSEERNYHIFYALLRGATPDSLKKLCLTPNLEDWALVKNAFKGIVKNVPDPELYKEVTDSFTTMKFSQEEQDAVWCYTAASLMVGNLDFDESTFSDASPCTLKNDGVLVNAAKILGIDFEKLSKALRFKTRVVGGSAIESTIKREECLIFRDSLSKDLFNKLFNWLVRRLNFTVMPPEFTKNGIDMNALMNKYYHIGLLDIFGFEIFNFNSIEQFCINFANEKLQQLYISYVFKGEEKEFINEGLKEFLGELNFKDNQLLIDMLDHNKLPGIFQMVDESCSVNATDQNLYDKIIKQFKKPEFPLTTQKIAKDTFIVKHTAKEVEYNINGFRAKNKDEISKTIEEAVCSSTMTEVVKIWKCLCLNEVESEEAKNAKANPKDKFLGFKFRSQMKELMDELNSCECHFIRCLKPNEKKQSDFFLPSLVLQQIKYMGVLDTIKVRKDSFPVRTAYKNFYEKYQELDKVNSKIPVEKHVENGTDFKELAKGICQKKVPHLGTKMILYGNNKMFLRVEAAKEIEKIRRDWEAQKHRSARKIQKRWFKFKHERLFRNMLKGVREVQKMYKISKEYLKFLKLRKKTKVLQRWWRRVLYKRKLKKMNESAVVIQGWWRMKFYSKRFFKTKTSAAVMNKLMRGAIGRKKASVVRFCRKIVKEIVNRGATELFEKVRIGAAKVIQKYAKGYVCRQKLKHLIQQVKQAKEDFIRNKHAKVIQKKARGFIVHTNYTRMRKAAIFIQGHMKMRWLSTLFQRLRTVSIKIQKAVKKWYIRRKVIKERMYKYMSTDGKTYKSLLVAEQVNFFGVNNIGKVGKNVEIQTPKLNGKEALMFGNESFVNTSVAPFNPSDRSLVSDALKANSVEGGQFEDYNNLNDNVNDDQSFILNAPKEYDPYGSKKIQLFTKILDVDLLSDTSLIYDPMWSIQILKLQNECCHTDTDIQLIEVGQAHTTVVPSNGKLYSFGWNDCFQLGRPTQLGDTMSSCGQISLPIDNFRPKSMAAGDDHNLVLDYQGNLYVWGDNSKGQLGLGHCRETSRMTILDFLSNDTITEIKAKGNNSLVLTQTGKVFYWPIQLNSGEKIYRPAELGLPPKIQISTASCGYNFTVLVAKNGYVFTFGRDNQAGQLGHGDNVSRDTPALVETLKNEGEIIVSASCGYKHVVCKSKLGKVYTWGWGKKGQLGHGELTNESKPRLVNVNQNVFKGKALQVQAGFKHSMVVLDNKKVMWWGTNASLECQSTPIEVNLMKKVPGYHKEFTPLKVLCAWSKTMNITYVVMADTRAADLNPMMKQKVLSSLSTKIEETSGLNDVDLPYIDSIAKHFSMKVMKDRAKEAKAAKPSNTLKKTAGPGLGVTTGTGAGTTTKSAAKFGKTIEVGGPPHYFESLQRARASPRADESFLDKTQQSIISSQKSPRSMVHSSSFVRKPTLSHVPSQSGLSSKSPRGQVPAIQLGNIGGELTSRSSKTQRSTSRESEKDTRRVSPARKLKDQKEEQLNSLGQKLIEIKRRVQEIMSSPMETWSKTDIEFIKMATEPKMLELLQNVKI